MFLTTSRDQTTRLYDLRFKPRQQPNNPPWPPAKRLSHAGPGFGLHMNESEGTGYGRCLAVLAGGRSGGHQAAVLHAVRMYVCNSPAPGSERFSVFRFIDMASNSRTNSYLRREPSPFPSRSKVAKAALGRPVSKNMACAAYKLSRCPCRQRAPCSRG